MRDDCTGKSACKNTRRHLFDHLPIDRTMPVMRPGTGDAAGNDGRHRGGQGHVNDVIAGKSLRRKREREDRHHHRAAADAQEACKKADEYADGEIDQPEPAIH